MASKEFEALSIPHWKLNLSGASAKVYRVFKNSREFETIEAENATEAISKCGTQGIYKVKFGSYDSTDILEKGLLVRPVEEFSAEQIDSPQPEAIRTE